MSFSQNSQMERNKRKIVHYAKLVSKSKKEGFSKCQVDNLEKNILLLMKRIFTWEGPISISYYGEGYSRLACLLVLFCNSDKKFQYLYYNTMLFNQKDYPQKELSIFEDLFKLK